MVYIAFVVIPLLLYIVGTVWMGRRFYRQADAAGVDPAKALSATGFGLSALIAGFALWDHLSGTGELEHVLSVTGAVVVGLTTQWLTSKWMVPSPPSDATPPSDFNSSP